jgi:iron(III) transport system substrate-binding protein
MSVFSQSLRCASTVAALTVLTASLTATAAAPKTSEVNIYSARQEALIKPLLDEFTAETDIGVNLVTGKGDALLTRLQSEGKNSPADVLLTTDAGRLYRAQEAGVLQPFASEYLKSTIPAHLRSSDDYWYGLSIRARFIVYAKDRVDPSQLDSYEGLADDQWSHRVCIRSSSNIYNQSLVAGMIASKGEDETAAWLGEFVDNFARPPQGGDRDQIKAVAAGQCDVAVVNSYYLGAMLNSAKSDERDAAAKVAVFWPNQKDRGTHINVSGAGITASAKHRAQAQQLIEFLARDESQKWYAETNMEFPVRPDVEASALLKSWGEYKADPLDVTELGRLNARAVMAMDRARWK